MTKPNVPFEFFTDEFIKPLTTSFQKFDFQRTMDRMILSNDTVSGVNGSIITASFNGTDVAWKSKVGETIAWDVRRRNAIHLKGQLGGESYRLSAWIEI